MNMDKKPNKVKTNNHQGQELSSAPKDAKTPFHSKIEEYKGFLSFAKFVLIVLGLIYVITSFALHSYQVVGNSMHPTLSNNDRLIISKLGKSWSQLTGKQYIPERGEIVIFEDPRNPDIQLIKRVIALPNERVEINNGNVTVYNESNPQGFDPDLNYGQNLPPTAGDVNQIVPEGHIFVMGDNRSPGGSLDSRNDLGTVPSEYLVGKLIIKILPLGSARFFDNFVSSRSILAL